MLSHCSIKFSLPLSLSLILLLLTLSTWSIHCQTTTTTTNHEELFGPEGFLTKDHYAFEEFVHRFNKTYNNDINEKVKRFHVFKDNLAKIDLLNKHELGSAVYGITPFADLEKQEFVQHHLGLQPQLYLPNTDLKQSNVDVDFSVKDVENFDWRTVSGVVSAVKNQGQCGSCWAFSATGNVEGVYGAKYKQAVSLSEQELVDCDKMDAGCGGGLPTNAFQTIIKLGGLETESDYPYDAKDEQCHFNRSMARVKIDSYVELPQKNETYMKNYLIKNGPLSIGINAMAMQFYFGGISHPPHFLCGDSLDHGVLIVGFGIGKTSILHKTQPFWIVKNSWGPNWGEKGYYRVYRGDNTCGLATMVSSSIIN